MCGTLSLSPSRVDAPAGAHAGYDNMDLFAETNALARGARPRRAAQVRPGELGEDHLPLVRERDRA